MQASSSSFPVDIDCSEKDRSNEDAGRTAEIVTLILEARGQRWIVFRAPDKGDYAKQRESCCEDRKARSCS